MLVVDAEPLTRWAVGEALTAAGFDVIEMKPDPPYPVIENVRVLIVDATLAGVGALRVLEHVRGLNPACRVLLLTSFDEVGFARIAGASPLWRAVQKPFEVPALVQAVVDLSSNHARSAAQAK